MYYFFGSKYNRNFYKTDIKDSTGAVVITNGAILNLMLEENMDFCLPSLYPSYTIRVEVVWADRGHIPSWKSQNDKFFLG